MDNAMWALLFIVIAMLAFEAGYSLGRRAALDDVVSVFDKLPMRKDIRKAIDDGINGV